MEANTKYEDFLGTSSGDRADWVYLKDILEKRGIDTNRYTPVGVDIYSGYELESLGVSITASIICIDNDQSTEDKKYIVNMYLNEPITGDDVLKLFKRLNVVLIKKQYIKDVGELYIDEEIRR